MSNIEFEVRIIDIDKDSVIKKIKSLDGKYLSKHLYRRYVFDIYPPTTGIWLRLRTDGTTATLTAKEISADTLDGTKEWETVVESFDETFAILKKAGLTPKSYQENRRTNYKLDDVILSIDEWPLLPICLELESTSAESINRVAKKLGYKDEQLTGKNIQKIYMSYGIDLEQTKELRLED